MALRRTRLLDYEKADLVFIGFLIILSLWLFLPGLQSNRIMLVTPDDFFVRETGYDTPYGAVITDINVMYQPWNDYACGRLKAGQFPYWNPYVLCGTHSSLTALIN